MTIDFSTWDTERDLRVYALPDGRGLYVNGVAAIVTRDPAIVGAEAAPEGLATGVAEWLAWPVIARGVRDAIVAVLPAPAPPAAKAEDEKCRTCDGTGEKECKCCDGQGTLECGNLRCGRFHECNTCDGTGRADCDDCDTPPAKDEPIRAASVYGCDIDVRYLATLRGMGPCDVRRGSGTAAPMVFDDGTHALVVMPIRSGCELVGEVTL